MAFLIAYPALAGTWPPVVTPTESTPAKIGELEFSIVTQAEWTLPHAFEADVIFQLRISNPTQEAVLFPSFDTFTPFLTGPDGKVSALGGNRDATRISPNFLIPSGKSFSYPLSATLKTTKSKDSKTTVLFYQNHTGAQSTTPMTTGEYSISISLRPTHYDFKIDPKTGPPLWASKGTTHAVKIKASAEEKP